MDGTRKAKVESDIVLSSVHGDHERDFLFFSIFFFWVKIPAFFLSTFITIFLATKQRHRMRDKRQ